VFDLLFFLVPPFFLDLAIVPKGSIFDKFTLGVVLNKVGFFFLHLYRGQFFVRFFVDTQLF